jgi:protein-L-isoaspartate(D-aspartate) O-methyltransferase
MRPNPLLVATALALAGAACAGPMQDAAMRHMLAEIRADARDTEPYTGQAAIGPAVLDAMREVPREQFVPANASDYAYENRPLPIGHGQTISQPFIVALMTDLLEPQPDDRVLEIGTGSGYQAAVLAKLVAEVYTIEIIPELARTAAAVLMRLGYTNVHVEIGDGWHGWPAAAPFDGIIVTAVAPEPPPELLAQLEPGGRLVMPLGEESRGQMLVVLTKQADGSVDRRDVLPVQFVPLTGKH